MKLAIVIAVAACEPQPIYVGPGVVPGPRIASLDAAVAAPAIDARVMDAWVWVRPGPPTPVVEESHAWWCLTVFSFDRSTCYREKERCDALRGKAISLGAYVSECDGQDAVACYRLHNRIHDFTTDDCSASFRWCKLGRDDALVQKDDIDVLGECRRAE